MPDIDEKDIQNEKMREQEYKAVILSGDNEKIASILINAEIMCSVESKSLIFKTLRVDIAFLEVQVLNSIMALQQMHSLMVR